MNFEDERLQLLDDRAKLTKLFDMGLKDSTGDPIFVEPPNDNKEIKNKELMNF